MLVAQRDSRDRKLIGSDSMKRISELELQISYIKLSADEQASLWQTEKIFLHSTIDKVISGETAATEAEAVLHELNKVDVSSILKLE